MADDPSIEIAVVGSANVDLSVTVPELPGPGETVLGGDLLRGSGGKGANQAVAAARLGRRVAMIGRVGDDDSGRWVREQLRTDQVDVRSLLTTADAPTGTAVIAVDPAGENTIVVSPGANARVTGRDLEMASAVLAEADVVVAQLEIPLAVVAELPALAGGLTILNPAPAASDAPLDGFDLVVPNRGELAALAGAEPTLDPSVIVDQARTLSVPTVVVTLGAQGAMVVGNGDGLRTPADVVTVPAMPVDAVDATAAGDSFCGALAVALVEGADVVRAVNWAVRVAGSTVTRRGAQESLPDRSAVGSWRD